MKKKKWKQGLAFLLAILVFATTITGTYYWSGDRAIVVAAEQTSTPSVRDEVGTAGSTSVSGGQNMVFTQSGGTLGDASSSFFGFNATTDLQTMSADIIVNSCGNSNNNGIFFGAFGDDGKMVTLGIRKSTSLYGIYTNTSNAISATGANDSNGTETVALGTRVHFSVTKTSEGMTISYQVDGGNSGTKTYKNSDMGLLATDGSGTSLHYGFVLSNVTATVSNMKLIASDSTVLYDQNSANAAVGSAPVPTAISGTVDDSRQNIVVTWEGSDCADDGTYLLQVSTDGSNFTTVAENLLQKSYTYPISGNGSYYFRVYGMLGYGGSLDGNTNYQQSGAISALAALSTPNVTVTSAANAISLSWDAVSGAESYDVYRYSYDETESGVALLTNTTATTLSDAAVTSEMPYYYYVVAKATGNSSNASATVWGMASAGHSGSYVYEDEAAKITISNKSNDTVTTDEISIAGTIDRAGTLVVQVNGTQQGTSKSISAGGSFSYDLTLVEGRNDVTMYFTDSQGAVTRQTFNFVYLTNYDIIVDASFTGTDGTKNSQSIPQYKTVQAALDSISASNTERKVIFIKNGSYVEHLQVTKPYVSLIGEDSDGVNINYYDEVESPRGGDMAKRCATYVQSTATGFSAENLTFENTYAYTGSTSISNESADALRVDASNATFVNVNIKGYQDTLCTNAGSQYFYKCKIYGNIDYIYGNEPRAYFNDCQLIYRYNSTKDSGYIAAPKTSASAAYGLVFNNCQVLAESGCSTDKYKLARPWGSDAYVVFINCFMGKTVDKDESYADMSGNTYAAARFFEYNSYGIGYEVNANRRQISAAKAASLTSSATLGWDPVSTINTISADYYIGTTTETPSESETTTAETNGVLSTDTTSLSRYNLEGYALAGGTTGGGVLAETDANYYSVATAEEFLDAMVIIKKNKTTPSVIEITADIGLGSLEVENFSSYSSVITAYKDQALVSEVLKKSGTSILAINEIKNLTIFSKNGSKVLHANIDIKGGSSNIMIRNLVFDELWEWDEGGLTSTGSSCDAGDYDRNDWDYMTIEGASSNVWIDHCTFYKAYDGIVDIKKPNKTYSNVTISWCEFLPGSSGTFFDDMMAMLESAYSSGDKTTYAYYSELRDAGMTAAQVKGYAYGQKKTHLFGHSDSSDSTYITATLANNYYLDSMDRMPRLRYGTVHEYNCTLNAIDLYNIKKELNASSNAAVKAEQSKITSNGASSTEGGSILLENCNIQNIMNALNSGNGSSRRGYINAINSIYTCIDFIHNNTELSLEAKVNVSSSSADYGKDPLVTDVADFVANLPAAYGSYLLYDANNLNTLVNPYAGANKITLSTTQWEQTVYAQEETPDVEETPEPEEPSVARELTLDYETESVTVPADMEYSMDGTNWNTGTGKAVSITSLIPAYGNSAATFYYRELAGETKTLEIAARPAAPTGILATATSYTGRTDGTITGVTTAMEYRLSTDSAWTAITASNSTNGTLENLAEGIYQIRYPVLESTFASAVTEVTVLEGTDTQAPVVEATLGTNKWKEFLNTITFGLFFKENVEVTVTATDDLSGLDTISYYKASAKMTEDNIKALSSGAWTNIESGEKIAIEPSQAVILYIRALDQVGNVRYISTDGIVVEDVAPVINGVTDGESYEVAKSVTVEDDYLDEVVVYQDDQTTGTQQTVTSESNGKKATFTLAQNASDTTYRIEAVDKAGNKSSCSITIVGTSTLNQQMLEALATEVATNDFVVAQEDANAEEQIKTWLVTQVNALTEMTNAGITVTASDILLQNVTAAVEGDADLAAGTAGSFEFQLVLSNAQGSYTTETMTGSITATEFTGLSNADAVQNAKDIIEGGTYQILQANSTEEEIVAYLVETINLLTGMAETGIVVTAENITISTRTGAIMGTDGNPTGTDGSFNFTVALTKGSATATTSTVTGTITATPYSEESNQEVLNQVKAAIEAEDYQIAMADANDLESVTNYLVNQVNNLDAVREAGLVITAENIVVDEDRFVAAVAGDADATAGSNGTFRFKVSLERGAAVTTTSNISGVIETEAYTGISNADAVQQVKTLLESTSFVLKQEDINTQEALLAYLVETIPAMQGITDLGVTITEEQIAMTSGSFAQAEEGTEQKPAGTDGKAKFVVTIQKGLSTVRTSKITVTITAKAYVAPTVEDTPTVDEDTTEPDTTIPETPTGGDSTTGDDHTNTEGSTSADENTTGGSSSTDGTTSTDGTSSTDESTSVEDTATDAVPTENVSVSVGGTIRNIAVIGMEAFFAEENVVTDKTMGVTKEELEIAKSGGNISIVMLVDKVENSQDENVEAERQSIQETAEQEGRTIGTYLTFTIRKTVTDAAGNTEVTIISETPTSIELQIQLDEEAQGKEDYVCYRYHGDAVDTITPASGSAYESWKNGDKEYIQVQDTQIIVYAKKFSTYAIAYSEGTTVVQEQTTLTENQDTDKGTTLENQEETTNGTGSSQMTEDTPKIVSYVIIAVAVLLVMLMIAVLLWRRKKDMEEELEYTEKKNVGNLA